MLRFGSYLIFAGLLTGLALYFQAELRDAAGWSWFGFGAIGLSVTLLSLLDSALRSGSDADQRMPARSNPAESAESVASEPGTAEVDAEASTNEE
jgi:hypothetical protein